MKLKLLLLSLISLFITQAAFSQRTIEHNKKWAILTNHWFVGKRSTNIYQFQKDTIINQQEYSQLYTTTDSTHFENWVPTKFFFREDQDNRIYALKSDQTEALIYDFNLEVNDTFPADFLYSECELIVDKVDSFELANGEFRKRIRLYTDETGFDERHPQYYKHWVQGIGSMSSLTHYIYSCFTDYQYELLCYYEDGEIIYDNPNHESCYFFTDIEEPKPLAEVQIHPNPVVDFIQVSHIDFNHYRLYNPSGQAIKSGQKTKQIDIRDLKGGLYMLQLTNDNNESYSFKLLLNN